MDGQVGEPLLDDVPVPVAVVDEHGRIQRLNAAAQARFGDVLGSDRAVLGAIAATRPLPGTSCTVVVPVESDASAERLARVLAVTARLGAAQAVDDVAAAICDHAATGVGARAAALLRLDEEHDELEVVRQVGFADDVTRVASAALGRNGVHVDHDGLALVPLHHGGRPLGVLVFGFGRASQIDDTTRRLLLAVATQASQVLDRIRAEGNERRARRRQELLARATGVLAGSLDLDQAATAVGRLVVQRFADSFSLHLDEGGYLQPAVVVNADAEREELMVEALPTAPGAAVVRYLDGLIGAGRSVLTPSIEPGAWEGLVGDESAASLLRALDVGGAVVVGLHAGGRRLGVLAVTRTAEQEPFDQDAFLLVAELAGRLAASADAALAHRARLSVTRTLQASLLPPRLPDLPGVTVAARYDPVGDGSLVGGDFYDVFPMGDDRWCVVLGDVCGQGVPAAALTSLVRYTIRAAARLWHSPSAILRFVNDAILDEGAGERFCTALVCVVRPGPDGAAVTLAVGGHHLPLLVPAGEAPRPVGRVGTALGLVRDPDAWDTALQLDVGDQLVLTTDGVIEARDEAGRRVPETFLDDLVAAHAPDGPEAIASAVERAVLAVGGGRAHDDVALVVLQASGDGLPADAVPSATLPSGGAFERRYPADTSAVTEARRAVGAWLEVAGITGARVPDLLLALTELVTNSVRAARTAVEVRAWLTVDSVMVEVTDDGPGFDPSVPGDPRELDPLAERGRGLFLVAALVDECTIESGPNGTIVRCYVSR